MKSQSDENEETEGGWFSRVFGGSRSDYPSGQRPVVDELDAKKAEIEFLQGTLSDVAARAERAELALTDLTQQLKSQSTKLNDAEHSVDSLRATANSDDNLVHQLQEEVAEQRKRASSYRNEVAQAKRYIEQKRLETKESDNRLEAVRAHNAKLEEKNNALTRQAYKYSDAFKKLKGQLVLERSRNSKDSNISEDELSELRAQANSSNVLQAELSEKSQLSSRQGVVVHQLREELGRTMTAAARSVAAVLGTSAHLAIERGLESLQLASLFECQRVCGLDETAGMIHRHLASLGIALETRLELIEESTLQITYSVATIAEDSSLAEWIGCYALACANALRQSRYRLQTLEGGPSEFTVTALSREDN